MRKGEINYGASEIMSPWADVVAEKHAGGAA
jgi:hypothetical protein